MIRWLAIIPLTLTLAMHSATAQSPGESIEAALELGRVARAAQQRIDKLVGERQRVLADIAVIESDGTADAVRSRELEGSISAVLQHLAEIDADIRAVSETQTGIVALLDAMIEALARFVELDLPFQLDQRRAVIAGLRADLGRSDIGVAEKYQSVVAAYLREVRFGYSNAVTRERIETPTGTRIADVLRLGRAGLWFATSDGAHAGRWDSARRAWTESGTDPAEVLTGIAVVRENGPPVPFRLPLQLDLP